MPCNWMRSALLGFSISLMPAAAPPARPQQDLQQRQDPLENSIDCWNRMSPEACERELAKLPPARARLIRQRLRRYNQMPPQEQQALRQRYQAFSQLPPVKQQVVRQRLHEFRQLPPARQLVVYHQVEQFGLLPENQREARVNSEECRIRYSPQEQQIIHDLTQYLEPPQIATDRQGAFTVKSVSNVPLCGDLTLPSGGTAVGSQASALR